MRKLYFILFSAFVIFSTSTTIGQVADYTFSQSNGAYTPITGGLLLGSTTTDDQRFVDPALPLGGTATTGPGLPIGFDFTYNGIVFDRVAINANGWITLGQAALTPSVNINSSLSLSAQLSATSTASPAYLRNRIAGFGRDLQGQAGAELRIETIGTAPNRKCIIQWSGYRRFAGGDNINFQIELNETTNVVRINYGSCVFTASNTAQSGLGGTTNADFNCRTTTSNWAATTAGPANNSTCSFSTTIAPPSGLSFAWAPPVPCSGVPSPGLISGPSGTLCGSVPVNLTLSGYTGDQGITFQWKSSVTAGGPYTNIPGATADSYSFTTSTTTYFIVTVTCTNSGLSSNTTEFAVNVSPLAHTNVSATPSTTCSPGSSAITGTAINGNVTGGGIGIIASSGTINLAIPDNNPAGVSTQLTIPPTSFVAANNLKVQINATHTWVGDLKFTLTSPCGTTFLFDRPGVPPSTVGNSQNLNGIYTFDLAAATVIPETNSGPTDVAPGSYLPSDASGASHTWAGFTFPCTGGGLWTLSISDNAGGDLGTLVDWSIIGPVPVVGNYSHSLTGPGTITQNPSTGPNNQTANFSVSALPAGIHSFTLTSTDLTGCTVSSPLTVTVNPTPVVTITPAAPVICAGDIVQLNGGAVPGVPMMLNSTVPIAIPATGTSGIAGPYPSTIVAGGLPTSGATVSTVTLTNFAHTFPDDVDVVLVSPTGQSVILMSDVGGGTDATGETFTFSDAAASLMSNASFNPTGTYQPTNIGAGDNYPAPGPLTAPTSTTLSTFTGNLNGIWNLYIVDDAGGDIGSLGGWSITFTTPSPVIFSPNTNLFTDAGATVPYTGTPVTTVWAKPPTTATYTASTTIAGCTSAPASVTITVNQLPAITVQPVAAAPICSGFNASYSVTATGTGLTYQWQLSTDNGGSWNNITNGLQYAGVTTTNLTVLSVAMAQNGHRFRCVVSGTCPPPATSNSVTLVVSTPPTISTQPPSRTICSGTNTTFTVVAAGVPTPTIYQWQVSTNAGGTWTNLTTGGSYTPSFTITGATTTQSGNWYRVIVTNICGQSVTSNAAVLTVNPTPVVTASALPSKICLSDGPIALSGSPVGGSWSGIGISGFNFVPTATSVGTYTLTYTYTNSFGCTANTTLIAKVQECPERIRLLSDDAVVVYPNPNSGNFNIRMNSVLYNYLGMNVYSNSGQQVYAKTFNGLSYGSVVPVNLTHLPSGIYMVKIFYDDGARTSEKTFPVVIGRQ